jgi:hypothetical protein
MFSVLNSTLDIDAIANDPAMVHFINKYFPEVYAPKQKKSLVRKASYTTGKVCGKAKNFFSKTETKAATLLSYWAADTLVAVFLLLTTSNLLAISLALAMLSLHTYATFSVVTEIMK